MIELRGTTSWYPDLNIECLTFLLFLPSHTAVQWLKLKFKRNKILYYRCGGSVGFAPTSQSRSYRLVVFARSIKLDVELDNLKKEQEKDERIYL